MVFIIRKSLNPRLGSSTICSEPETNDFSLIDDRLTFCTTYFVESTPPQWFYACFGGRPDSIKMSRLHLHLANSKHHFHNLEKLRALRIQVFKAGEAKFYNNFFKLFLNFAKNDIFMLCSGSQPSWPH